MSADFDLGPIHGNANYVIVCGTVDISLFVRVFNKVKILVVLSP